jgi:hypothetical protein
MIATIAQLKPAFVAAARPMRIKRRAGTAFASAGVFNPGVAEVGWADSEATVSGEGAVMTDAKSNSLKKCRCTHLFT